MSKIPDITDAEWQIMKELWRSSPQSVREVLDTLESTTNWSKTTIHTLFTRLENKGAIKLVEARPCKRYTPLIDERECVCSRMKSFLRKTCGGSFGKFLLNFAEGEELSDEDISELRSLLGKKEKTRVTS